MYRKRCVLVGGVAYIYIYIIYSFQILSPHFHENTKTTVSLFSPVPEHCQSNFKAESAEDHKVSSTNLLCFNNILGLYQMQPTEADKRYKQMFVAR